MLEDSRKMIDTKATRSFEVDSNPSREVDSAHPQINFKGGVKMAKSSNLQASFTLFKTFLGTGVLALPYAFKTAGMGLAILVVIFVSLITTLAFFLLLDVAEDKNGDKQMSLQKLTLEVLGDRGKHAVQASMMIMQLGCCIGVLIFVRTFLNHVLCEFEVESLCDNVPFNLFLAIILAVPLCMINNLHYFYIPALAANFFIIIGLTSQMFYNVETLKSAPGTGPTFGERLGEFNWTNLPLFFGIATYAFEGVGVIFSIRSSMEKPEDFPFLLKNQMAILTLIYIIFPVVSYMAIGDNIQDVVFFSLPTDDRFYLLIQILYAMSALFTFPIQLFPALRIIENSRALRYRLFNEKGKTKNKKLRYGIRLLVIACVFFVAYVANSFHLFLNLLGSCVFTFLGFVLPIWLYHKQFAGRIKSGTRIMNMIILVLVIFFGATGFVMSIVKMATLGDNDSE